MSRSDAQAWSALTRAVFFDVDFTLIHPGPVFQGEGYRRFCARHGVDNCDPEAFEAAVSGASALLDASEGDAYDPQVFIRYIRRVIEQMGGSGSGLDECAAEIYREWAVCHHFSLYEDALPAMRALRARGLKLGLISNTHRSLASFQSHFDLEELVSAGVSSCEHGYNKPHPSIFRTALRLLSVAPNEAVMVGDSFRHDVLGARAVGMHAILLERAGAGSAGLGDVDPAGAADVPVIRSLAELPGLLAPERAWMDAS